jgi:hypothetical protein
MRTLSRIAVIALLLTAGCHHQPTVEEPTFSRYHADGLDWCRVNRVLLLPLDNESPVSQASEQVRRALAEELQAMGRFEVVPAPPDVWAELSGQIRCNGRFNEADMIELARCTRSDLIIMGTVTQYSPYRLPLLGLALYVISPSDGVEVASVDGLWDSTHQDIAGRARAYYREASRGGRNAPFTETLALESPQYYQRFVCHEAVVALLSVPPPPQPPSQAGAGAGAGGVTAAAKGGAGCGCRQASTCKPAVKTGAADCQCAPVKPAAEKPAEKQEEKKPESATPDPATVPSPESAGPNLDHH